MFSSIHRTRQDEGFTLIELLITVVILTVIMGVAIPIYVNNKHSADSTAAKTATNLLSKTIADGIGTGSITGYTGTADGNTPLTGTLTTQVGSQAIGDAKVYYDSVGGTWCVSKKVGSVIWMSTNLTPTPTLSQSECSSSSSSPSITSSDVTLALASTRHGEVNLSWNIMAPPPGDWPYYEIWYQDPLASDPTAWIINNNAVTWNEGDQTTVATVEFDNTYITQPINFKIRAVSSNTDATLGFSNITTITPSSALVEAPIASNGLNVISGDKHIYLWWNAVASHSYKPVTGYKIYSYNGSTYTLLDTTNATSYDVLSLTNGTSYSFAVTTYGDGGESAKTSLVNAYASVAWINIGPIPGAGSYFAIAVSSNNSKIVVGSSQGVKTSNDSGSTWNDASGPASYSFVAASADGSKIATLSYGNNIYTSTDSGVTWTSSGSALNWSDIASSSNGTQLVAVAQNDHIYTSTDSGLTWTPRESVRNWNSIASSANGSKLVASAGDNTIYLSTDSGITWTTSTLPAGSTAERVTSSADGTKLYAVVGNSIYRSTDSGLTWTRAQSRTLNGGHISTSSSGQIVAVSDYIQQVILSTDYGVTWSSLNAYGAWSAIKVTDDGTRLFGSTESGSGWSSTDTVTSYLIGT